MHICDTPMYELRLMHAVKGKQKSELQPGTAEGFMQARSTSAQFALRRCHAARHSASVVISCEFTVPCGSMAGAH